MTAFPKLAIEHLEKLKGMEVGDVKLVREAAPITGKRYHWMRDATKPVEFSIKEREMIAHSVRTIALRLLE